MEVSIEGKLSTAIAAKKIGVSPASISNWIVAGKMPHVKAGNGYFMDPDTVETVKELVAEHGKKWHKFADFAQTATGKNKKSKKETEAAPEVEACSNAQKLAALGNKLKDNGHFEEAAETFSILVNHVDWSEVAL